MLNHLGIIFSLVRFVQLQNTSTDYIEKVGEIYRNLFENYDSRVGPWNEKIFVKIPKVIMASISESSATAGIIVAVDLRWNDPRLIWDPIIYGNVSSILEVHVQYIEEYCKPQYDTCTVVQC